MKVWLKDTDLIEAIILNFSHVLTTAKFCGILSYAFDVLHYHNLKWER